MYCTLDTAQVDMAKLLGNQLSFNHVIYAHTRGQTKEVRFVKSEEALGLTVTDNKAGGVFVKRISPTGTLEKVNARQADSVAPGDLIECINGKSFINSRHVDVVKYLKELPLNSEIVLRLISPEKNLLREFAFVAVVTGNLETACSLPDSSDVKGLLSRAHELGGICP